MLKKILAIALLSFSSVGSADPLHAAARDGDLSAVKALLHEGADVNARDTKGNTALHFAALKGHATVVEVLLAAHNIDVNAENHQGNTPLHFAATAGHIYVHNQQGNAHLDVHVGHATFVQALIAHGVHVNVQNQYGNTALHLAANAGHAAFVQALLAHHGVHVDVQNDHGITALRLATNSGNGATIQALLAHATHLAIVNANLLDQIIKQQRHHFWR